MNLEKIKKLASLLYSIAILLLLIVAILVIFSNLQIPGGYKLYSVQSGSMEPTIPVGSVVVVFGQKDYQVKDIVTFSKEAENKPTTHRIIEATESGGKLVYQTQGDANDVSDSGTIENKQIIGKVKFQIPLIGYLLNFTKTLPGLIILVIIPATIIIFTELLNIKDEFMKLLARKKTPETKSEIKEDASKPKDKKKKKE